MKWTIAFEKMVLVSLLSASACGSTSEGDSLAESDFGLTRELSHCNIFLEQSATATCYATKAEALAAATGVSLDVAAEAESSSEKLAAFAESQGAITGNYLVARLFEHAYFKGDTSSFWVQNERFCDFGQWHVPELTSRGFNNKATGAKTFRGCGMTLYDGIKFGGPSYVIPINYWDPNFGPSFNDKTSSLYIHY